MNTWRHVTINDLGQIITGSTPPTKKREYYGNEYPFITPTDIEIDSRLVHTERFLSQKGYEYNKNRLLPPNAICVVCIASIGKICMTTVPSVTNQQINSVVVDQQKYDPYFVYYLLRTKTNMLHNIAGGVASPIVNKSTFGKLEVRVPPLTIQRKIAAILSVYDDLIENNTRRIKILEDMAQTLYREWFVHFRFPGHENGPLIESPLGPIPEGWKVKRLDEVAQLHRGRSYRSINLVDAGEGLPFLNLKNINREGGFRRDGLKWYDGGFKETQVASSNDIIMALTDMTQDRKVVARSARVPDLGYEKHVFSMDLLKIKPDDALQNDFLYALLRYSSFAERLKEYANGTTVLHLSPSHVQSCKLVLPPNGFRQRYADIAKSVRQESDLLEKKNVNLRQTRDLLLPKLISGEIDVSELDIDINGMQPRKGGTHIPYPLTDRLHSDEKILGGKPVIKGTRLAVAFILDLLEQGWQEKEVLENYPSLAREDIEACRAYQQQVTRAFISG